jgi:hypothetical protein
MDYKRWTNSINEILGSLDHQRMLSEDLDAKWGILLRRWKSTKVLRNNGMNTKRVSKTLCYGKAEMLVNVEAVQRWWLYNVL